ncbi:MAG: hypothetical protein EBZ47_08520, partial [Chlamydiae bacterium]|nr:hypothetical protein [Chlamydiota bacterium]
MNHFGVISNGILIVIPVHAKDVRKQLETFLIQMMIMMMMSWMSNSLHNFNLNNLKCILILKTVY